MAEDVPNDVGTSLRLTQAGANAVDHLGTGCQSASTERIRLDVVIQERVGIEVGRLRWQEEYFDFTPVTFEPLPGRSGLIYGVAVEDQPPKS